tara:strand:- start:18398 stop:19384 length:987 start_codon:yes stop_codon:yes gene_type:complete
VSTTNPINGNTIQAVADNLIMETPDNPEKATDEVVEAIVDEQPEVTEEVVEEQDDVEAQANEEDLGEEYEEAEQDEVQPEPQYKVKVDGIETEVTLDELQRGYSGQKYIQKGMAENAETKKTLEEAQQQLTQERQVLQQLVQQLQNGDIPRVPEYPSEELRASDPLGYLEKEAEYRRAVDKRQQFEQQLSLQIHQETQAKQKAEQEFLSQQAMRLAEWMPEFGDPEKRSAFIQEVATKAKKHYNLSDEQINTVKYAEEVMVLNDAIKWRELQANKGKAQQKAEGARPVVKPAAKRAASAGKVSRAKKAEAIMRSKGDIDSVADYLLNP